MADCKTCSKCGRARLLTCFYKCAVNADGLRGSCNQCEAARKRQKKANDPSLADRQRQATRRWRSAQPSKDWTLTAIKTLKDSYLRTALGLTVATAPPELISLKREQLSLHRLTKQLKQEITNQLEKTQ